MFIILKTFIKMSDMYIKNKGVKWYYSKSLAPRPAVIKIVAYIQLISTFYWLANRIIIGRVVTFISLGMSNMHIYARHFSSQPLFNNNNNKIAIKHMCE